MKFGQFILYYKRKNFIKKFCKNGHLKTSSSTFVVLLQNQPQPLLENEIFEASYLH